MNVSLSQVAQPGMDPRPNARTDGAGTTVTFTTQANTPSPGFTTVTATVTGTATTKLFFRVGVTQN